MSLSSYNSRTSPLASSSLTSPGAAASTTKMALPVAAIAAAYPNCIDFSPGIMAGVPAAPNELKGVNVTSMPAFMGSDTAPGSVTQAESKRPAITARKLMRTKTANRPR